jgi:DNA-binding beta-propeller fold protein YncE
VEVGKQPSGLDISKKGDLALVTNRADNSISILSSDSTRAEFALGHEKNIREEASAVWKV